MKNPKIRSAKEISKSLHKGLNEALDYVKSDDKNNIRTKFITLTKSPTYKGKDVKRIRHKVSLTQGLFAKSLGVSVKTVEAWEASRNIPQGPAQKILFILDKKPDVIKNL